MEREKKHLIISIIIVAIIIGFIAGIPLLSKSKNKACTQEAKVCDDGTVVVREGDNCEFAPCPDVETNRVYCEESQRQADACIEIYQPVCGYSDPEKIQCVRAPCASTYPNSCFACMDENVEYWVDGVCE